jgi:hypothetical protein
LSKRFQSDQALKKSRDFERAKKLTACICEMSKMPSSNSSIERVMGKIIDVGNIRHVRGLPKKYSQKEYLKFEKNVLRKLQA